MRDVEEGMAQWTCIQYMYLSGYEEYMDARLPLERKRSMRRRLVSYMNL